MLLNNFKISSGSRILQIQNKSKLLQEKPQSIDNEKLLHCQSELQHIEHLKKTTPSVLSKSL